MSVFMHLPPRSSMNERPVRGRAIALMAILAELTAPLAHADPGAPAQPPVGTGGKIFNPHIDTDSGEIEAREVPVDVKLGGLVKSDGTKGGELKASANYDLYIFGGEHTSFDEHTMGAVFRLGLGADGRIQVTSDSKGQNTISAYRMTSPSLALASMKLERSPTDTTPRKMHGGASFELLSVVYENESNKPIGLKINAALIDWVKASGQVAFKINGVNFDLCTGLNGTLRAGEINIAGQKQSSMVGLNFTACAGVQIGKIANLRDEFQVSSMYSDNSHNEPSVDASGKHTTKVVQDALTEYAQVSNTVRADKIGGSPVGVYWERRWESTSTGGQSSKDQGVTTNTFGAALRF